jgi:hypothetical protein
VTEKVAQVFSPQFGRRIAVLAAALLALAALTAAATAYYWTPAYWRVGYQPQQPIEYSHTLHVGQLGLDCRYCHTYVEESGHANVPTAQVCMNCHGQQWGNIKAASAKLAPLRDAWDTGKPIPWVGVHELADYAFFDHSVHIARGVGCVSCHGPVDQMEEVWHVKPLSMAWCLDCHRNWEPHMRPADEATNMQWSAQLETDANLQALHADLNRYLKDEVGINPPETCSACHR